MDGANAMWSPMSEAPKAPGDCFRVLARLDGELVEALGCPVGNGIIRVARTLIQRNDPALIGWRPEPV